MIQDIDFQEGYESREDGTEAKAKRVHCEMLPSVQAKRGKMREIRVSGATTILVQNNVADLKFSAQMIKRVAVIPPELFGDCEERHEGLDSLVWDLTEDGDADKIDCDTIRAAALNLIMKLGETPTPELMMVAIRWARDEVDPYVELDDCEWPRLHVIAEEDPATYQIFRKAMRKIGFDLPSSFPQHVA